MSVIETVKTYLGAQSAGDIRALLHEDHKEILSLVREMAEAGTADKRMSYFHALKPFLTAHARAEETIVYVPMTKAKGEESRDLANEGFVEHSLVDVLMERMGKPGVAGSDGWKAHAAVVKELLEHHIKEEEGEIFAALDKQFSDQQRQAMAVNFTAEKARLTKGMRSPRAPKQR
ncbi:MAG: hemerythrin domain-containing protein [Casimicrobiaceae bacterium]